MLQLNILFESIMKDSLTPDQVSNIVQGLKELYQLKFSRTFSTFEDCVCIREL